LSDVWAHADLTVLAVLRAAVDNDPDRVVVTFTGDRGYTSGEIWQRALRVAVGLRDNRVDVGDHIGIFVNNRIELLTAWFGAFAAGCVAVPLNTAQRGAVLRHMLAQTEVKLVIVEAGELPAIADVIATVPGLRAVAVVPSDSTPYVLPSSLPSSLAQLDFAAWESGRAADPIDVDPTGLASLMLTSGSTGPSKAVMWSHRTAVMMASVANDLMEYTPDDVIFTALPLFHANALFSSFLGGLLAGARVAVAPRFSASQFLSQAAEQQATKTSLLGTMPGILYRRPPSSQDRAHSIRHAFIVPAPLGYYPEFEERFGIEIVQFYGLTDMNTVVGVPPSLLSTAKTKPTSCGVPNRHWQVKVVDEQDQEVPRGEIGELVLRNRVPFTGQLGYFGMPDRTVASWRNLWFHTRDQFVQDHDGWLYFVDREQDAIRRSGENVSSIEVEAVLRLFPGVVEAAVFAVPSPDAEDEIMAVCQVGDDWTGDFEELLRYCYRELAYFAVPRYFEAVDQFPRTASEKIRKDVLRASGITADTWDRGPGGRKSLEQRMTRSTAQ
jgi:crotonobetaine/carnitine-CoA ligase